MTTIRVTKQQLEELFRTVRYDKRGGKWKGKALAARKVGLSRPTIDKILAQYPEGMPQKPKTIEPQFVGDYKESVCHRKVLESYTDKKTGKLASQGLRVDRMGLDIYLMAGQRDPATLPLSEFQKARNDARFLDPDTGDISFHNLSALRIVMTFAGIDPKRYKEFTTKGTKREPQRKQWYLDETELIQLIYSIGELDTLVFSRVGFEGGGRFSSTSQVTTDKIAYDLSMIEMREPKVSQTEERYFVPCTLEFIRQYVRDQGIIGRLFRETYEVYNKRLRLAGLKAGLWRKTGKYVEKTVRKKGKWVKFRIPLHEGKKTTTHLLKHTFVSLSSLHGFGLDDASEQTGTDPATLKKFYLGVGKKKLKGVILGVQDYTPWHEWIKDTMHGHWQKRYEQLKAGKI